MKEDNQRVRITKRMIKDSLIRLLYEESIHKLTVKQICEEAEINRTTFYKYYGSQYDLLEEMEEDLINKINDYLSATDVAGDNEQLFAKTISLVSDNIDLCKLLVNNNIDSAFPEKLLLSLRVTQSKVYKQILHKYTKDEIEYVFHFLVGGGFALIKAWINKESREPPERIAALLTSTLEKLLHV